MAENKQDLFQRFVQERENLQSYTKKEATPVIPERAKGQYFYDVISKTSPELVLAEDGETAVSCSLGEITCHTNALMPLDFECRLISVARDYSFEKLGISVALIQATPRNELTGDDRLVRYALNPANTDEFELSDTAALSKFLYAYANNFDECVENFARFAGGFCADESGYEALRQIWSPGDEVTPELWIEIMNIRDDFAVKMGYRTPNRQQRLKAAQKPDAPSWLWQL